MSTTYTGLEAGTALTGTEIIPMEQGGELKQTTTQDIANLGGVGYLVYTALLTQSGTNAPVATVLENTLGGAIVWSYIGNGSYDGTLSGAFTANKTIGLLSSINFNSSAKLTRTSNDVVNLFVQNEGSGGAPADNLLTATILEIRVYP